MPALARVRVPEGGAGRQVKPGASRPSGPAWHPAQKRRRSREICPPQRLQVETRGEGTIGPTRPRTHRGHPSPRGRGGLSRAPGGHKRRITQGVAHRPAQKPGNPGRPPRPERVSGTRGGTTKAQPIQARRLESAVPGPSACVLGERCLRRATSGGASCCAAGCRMTPGLADNLAAGSELKETTPSNAFQQQSLLNCTSYAFCFHSRHYSAKCRQNFGPKCDLLNAVINSTSSCCTPSTHQLI